MTADIKTAAAHGCFAITCPTALTVQSTTGVRSVQPLPPDVIFRTLAALAEDFEISAVRIGMLGTAPIASEVARSLRQMRLANIVVDPVLRSSSGAALLDAEGLAVLRDEILRIATVVTPNVEEAEVLTGIPVLTDADHSVAARKLLELGTHAAIVTGGHREEARDVLAWKDGSEVREQVFTGTILKSTSTHGTGCAFAMAIACGLANGISLIDSARQAKAFVRRAIETAPGLGHGRGPLNLL